VLSVDRRTKPRGLVRRSRFYLLPIGISSGFALPSHKSVTVPGSGSTYAKKEGYNFLDGSLMSYNRLSNMGFYFSPQTGILINIAEQVLKLFAVETWKQ